MANGDEGGIAAWQVQDLSETTPNGGGYDRKLSSFESRMLHQQGDDNNHYNTTPSSSNGMGESSIVNPNADRRLPANFPGNFASSENFGRLSTDVSSMTDPDVTRNRSRVDTTNPFGSSSSCQNTILHQHFFTQQPSLHNDQQLQSQHQLYSTSTASNINPFSNNNNNQASTESSCDLHLDPSVCLTTSFNLSPSGSRDALWNARLGSGIPSTINNTDSQRPSSTITTQSSQTQPHVNVNQHNSLALSSTPQQSNLSSKSINIIPNTSATTIPSLQLNISNSSTTNEARQSSSMGHNNVDETSWALESYDTKMDRSTPEAKNPDGDDSTVQSTAVLSVGALDVGDSLSPASSPRLNPTAGPSEEDGQPTTSIIGTPSTVSTTPSTEDASLTDSIDKIGLKLDPTYIEPFTLHRRAPSWDRSPVPRQLYADTEIQQAHQRQPHVAAAAAAAAAAVVVDTSQYWLPQQHQQGSSHAQAYVHHQQQQHQLHATGPSPWAAPHTSQQQQSRVASFRNDETDKHDSRAANYHQQFARVPPQHGPQERWHQAPPRPYAGDGGHLQYPGQQQARGGVHMQQQQQHPEGMVGPHGAYRANQGYNPYHPVQRKPGYPPQHPMAPSQSPQRTTRGPRPPGGPSPHRQQQAGGGPVNQASSIGGGSSRSSSEILKTLLRKKACLYEPDTSRSVALVTWLVGRELALEHGYFSRQQLQAGVHACVAEKIETGTITRTKVNRCMQIILNSCFHYIIPRPDGTEEKGHTFRTQFEGEVSNDASLLRLLPAPWNDLMVGRETVLKASLAELEGKSEPRSNHASPKGSPTLKPADHRSPVRDHHDGETDSKRAVLLCFNENVRAAEDVFRCHNEFIRDSAHSSNLQLTAQEWRIFFGKEAASAPHIWGNVGIPVVAVESNNGSGRKVDVLGQMTPEEAGKFRTTWCAKRYDHDHEFCGMAHVEVNGGWLRRNPNVHWYKDEFCPHIAKIADKRGGAANFFVINECPKGVDCEFAHSREEMIYHPNGYKSTACASIMRTGGCRFGDICPNHHPSDSARPAGKKGGEGRPPSARHGRSSAQSGGGKNAGVLPIGSPILYASPAPTSSFEKHLLMPGLQHLFRRQCTVARAYLRNPKCRCCYSYFGDDAGIGEEPAPVPNPRPGLPPPSQQLRM